MIQRDRKNLKECAYLCLVTKDGSVDGTEGGGGGGEDQTVLDPSLTNFYDAYRLFYSEMLRRCGLLIKAVEITHLMSTNTA